MVGKKMGAFCTKVVPGSPLSRLQSWTQGIRAQPSVPLSGETPGSFWRALGMLQPLPAGPDTWQLRVHCSRDLLATSPLPCHCCDPPGTVAREPRGQGILHSCLCPRHPSTSTSSPQCSHQARGCPCPPSQACPCSSPLSSSPHGGKTLTNDSHQENELCSVHGGQAGSICSENRCLQEGGRNLPPKPAGIICGPLGWGTTANQRLQKQTMALEELLHRQACLSKFAARFASKRS